MKQSQITLIAIAVAVVVVLATLVYLNSGEEQKPYDGDDDDQSLAADFSLPIVDDGRVFQLSSQRGKVVVIDFFATWCSPCATQIEHLKDLTNGE